MVPLLILSLAKPFLFTCHLRVRIKKTFKASAERACTYLVEACGAKAMRDYSRGDALAYRDYVIAKGLVGVVHPEY